MNYKLLKLEFERIKEKGWIPSIKKGPSGIGATFEKQLDLEENRFPYADYFGIEIKTHRSNQNYAINLFSSTPKGKHQLETNYLREKYGYPDKITPSSKVLNVTVYGNQITNIGINYKASLMVNDSTQNDKSINVYKNKTFIEGTTYWRFKTLKERLQEKCAHIALITADRKFIKGKEYFKYKEIKIYKLKSFNTFLKLIENGTIFVNFKVSVFRKGPRMGQIHDHGTGFAINSEDFEKLFERIH